MIGRIDREKDQMVDEERAMLCGAQGRDKKGIMMSCMRGECD